jgi:hypothetical protein
MTLHQIEMRKRQIAVGVDAAEWAHDEVAKAYAYRCMLRLTL